MAGTILIAMLILGVGVYLAINFSQTSDTYYKRWNTEQVQQYNEQITRNFTIENGDTLITAQGIITIRNLIKMSKYDGVTSLVGRNDRTSRRSRVRFSIDRRRHGHHQQGYVQAFVPRPHRQRRCCRRAWSHRLRWQL